MEPSSSDQQAVERDLREFLAANYFLGDDPSQLAASDSLIEAGLADFVVPGALGLKLREH